ncbi:MAG: hypothetical protein JRJ57_10805 [Deltaproteobacteria bacterium]|nr:hypothetical protein [Deltaproteobacteria bacterium]
MWYKHHFFPDKRKLKELEFQTFNEAKASIPGDFIEVKGDDIPDNLEGYEYIQVFEEKDHLKDDPHAYTWVRIQDIKHDL